MYTIKYIMVPVAELPAVSQNQSTIIWRSIPMSLEVLVCWRNNKLGVLKKEYKHIFHPIWSSNHLFSLFAFAECIAEANSSIIWLDEGRFWDEVPISTNTDLLQNNDIMLVFDWTIFYLNWERKLTRWSRWAFVQITNIGNFLINL